MIRIFYSFLMTALLAFPAYAEFDRPIPQAQSATAEGLYFTAALVFVATLIAVYWSINRKK